MKEKYLLIGFHDVSPFFNTQIDKFLVEFERRCISNVTFFITPNWYEKNDIGKNRKFIQRFKFLEKNGAELALHGYSHHNDCWNNGNKKEITNLLNASTKIFQKAFNQKPKGFLPPMWRQNEITRDLLIKKGFIYSERFSCLEYFNKAKISGFPIGMESYSDYKHKKTEKITPVITKAFSNIYARLVWNRKGIIRYSIHPGEVDNGNFNSTLKLLDGFLKRGWKPMTYLALHNKLKIT